MAEAKAGAKKASSSAKGEAARAEKRSETKTVDFRGLSIELPAKPPLAIALRSHQIKREFEEDESAAGMRMLELVLGPQQFEAFVAKCEADGLSMDDSSELDEVIAEIEGMLGVGMGES